MDEDIAEKVTMVTVTKQNSNNSGDSYRNNEYRNNRNNRPPRDGQGQRRGRQEPSGPPVTECAFCELIRNKDVSQELLKLSFKERHQVTSSSHIFANQCLPWLRLSMEDRERVLENNGLKCKICLRHLKNSENRGSICRNRHSLNNGRNGLCRNRGCDYHSTLCREHYNDNKERHILLRDSMDWADRVNPQPVRQHMSFLKQVGEDTESTSEKVLEG